MKYLSEVNYQLESLKGHAQVGVVLVAFASQVDIVGQIHVHLLDEVK